MLSYSPSRADVANLRCTNSSISLSFVALPNVEMVSKDFKAAVAGRSIWAVGMYLTLALRPINIKTTIMYRCKTVQSISGWVSLEEIINMSTADVIDCQLVT